MYLAQMFTDIFITCYLPSSFEWFPSTLSHFYGKVNIKWYLWSYVRGITIVCNYSYKCINVCYPLLKGPRHELEQNFIL